MKQTFNTLRLMCMILSLYFLTEIGIIKWFMWPTTPQSNDTIWLLITKNKEQLRNTLIVYQFSRQAHWSTTETWFECCSGQQCPEILPDLTTFSVAVRVIRSWESLGLFVRHIIWWKQVFWLVNNRKYCLMVAPNLNRLGFASSWRLWRLQQPYILVYLVGLAIYVIYQLIYLLARYGRY